MRILHSIDSGGVYGAERMLIALANHQRRQGADVSVCSIGLPGERPKALEQELNRQGIRYEALRIPRGLSRAGARAIVGHALEQGCDVIHSHGYKSNILLGLLAPTNRPGLVTTLHGWTHASILSSLQLYRWAECLAVNGADAVCPVTPELLTRPCAKVIQRRRCRVVENGLDTDAFDTARRARRRSDIEAFCASGRTIGAVGRLSREKGFDHLLAAFATLSQRFSDLRLVIFGDGPLREAYQQQIRSQRLQERVLLTGYVQDIPAYLPLCTIFTISSLAEGLPITLLEAMYAEVPVVSTAVGGIPDVLNHGRVGRLVSPGDPQQLGDALGALLDDASGRTALAAQAKARLLSRYTAAEMASRYFQVYAEIRQP